MKWEYKTIILQAESFSVEAPPNFESPEMDKFLNQLGQVGWELVANQGIIGFPGKFLQSQYTEFVILFFKRPLE